MTFALRIAAAIALPAAAGAQTAAQPQRPWNAQEIIRAEDYVRPPAEVERIILAPRTDITFSDPSPDRRWFLKTEGKDRGDVAQYGKPWLALAGLQVEGPANRARSLTTSTVTGLVLVNPVTGVRRSIEIPRGATVSAQRWSPAGTHVGYIANYDRASHLMVADAATGKSVQVTRTPLLATLVTAFDWTADGRSVIVVQVPDGRGPEPTHGPNGIEDGPQVRLTEGRAIPQVMHASLLQDPHDRALLEYYTTGQIAAIDIATRAVRKIGAPAMFRAVDASPDGAHVRVTRMLQPFSYLVPASQFASVQEVWDASGTVLATLSRTPPPGTAAGRGGRGGAPAAGADTARRNVQWNPAGPGMIYLQPVLGAAPSTDADRPQTGRGGAGAGAPARIVTSMRLVRWNAPFGAADTATLYHGSPRMTGAAYGSDGRTLFVADSGVVLAVRPGETVRRFSLGRGVTLAGAGGAGGGGGRGGGAGGAGADTSTAGGVLAMRRNASGENVVAMASGGSAVFASGTRAPGARWATQAPRPWMDRIEIETAQRSRVFDSPADSYDEMLAPLDDDYRTYIFSRQSPTVIADAWLRDGTTGSVRKLTANVDVAPSVTGAQRKRLQVTRPRDGFRFWVDVTLPRDWQPGTRLPGVLWFYPREYTTQAQYEQSRYTANINLFPEVPAVRPASAIKLWVTQGYAVIEPDAPVVGDSGRINDNYTRDLRENLDAVVDAVVEAGFVDRNKLGLGGHSYGAFSTVNAMTLVPYFKAGIAGDGMYNRSLTPFGFQSESRNFFQAMDTYLDMSPFFRADKLSGALLLYHNGADQNVGTAVISSQRLFHALQGLGKTAALYIHPYEDHSVATYQSDLDQWARWFAWFEVYVKGAKSSAAVP